MRNKKRIRRVTSRYGSHDVNFWHKHDSMTYSKIVLRDAERLWLSIYTPMASLTWERIPDYKSSPLYRSGEWNGMAYMLRFSKLGSAGMGSGVIRFRMDLCSVDLGD